MEPERITKAFVSVIAGMCVWVAGASAQDVSPREKFQSLMKTTDVQALFSKGKKKTKFETPYAQGRMIVKFHSEGEHALTECLSCVLSEGKSFSEITSDGSDSLDELFSRFGIKGAKPLVPRTVKGVSDSDDIRENFEGQVEDIKKRFPLRSQRAVGNKDVSDMSHIYVLEVPEETDIKEACSAFEEDSHVAYCHPDYMMRPQAVFVPDDPYYFSFGTWGQTYDDLWGLKKIQMTTADESESAWDYSLGENIVVAVLDTGLDKDHFELANNVWVNEDEIFDNGVDDDGNGYIDDHYGWNFEEGDNNLLDSWGHGTLVAGIIAAENNGDGIIGVAPKVKVMGLKLPFNQDASMVSFMVPAIMYAVDNGADVVNISWSTLERTPSIPALEDAIQLAHSLGVVVVVSAGNEGDDVIHYSPANMSETITVSATDQDDQRATFGNISFLTESNFGEFVDVAAPGKDVLTLSAHGHANIFASFFSSLNVGNDFFRAEGTSMSAPHVAGVSALILSRHPTFSNEDVRQILRVSADDLGEEGFDADTGYGRINALRAVKMDEIPSVRIEEPAHMSVINILDEFVSVRGAAYGPHFKEYQLSYRAADEPDNWIFFEGPIPVPVSGDIFDDTLVDTEWDIGSLAPGDYILRIEVITTTGLTFEDKAQVTAEVINQPPVFEPVDHQSGAIGEELTFTVKAHDPDGHALIYEGVGLPVGATVTTEHLADTNEYVGVFRWTPADGQLGMYSVTFNVTDGYDTVVSEPVGIVIEDANTPPKMLFLRRLGHRVLLWRGYDKEDAFRVKYIYRIDEGDWSEPTRKRFFPIKRLDLDRGWHRIEVKAMDKNGALSESKTVSFKVKDRKFKRKHIKKFKKKAEKIEKKAKRMERKKSRAIERFKRAIYKRKMKSRRW